MGFRFNRRMIELKYTKNLTTMRKLILILWAGILSVLVFPVMMTRDRMDYHSINEVKISDWKKEVIRLFLRVIL